MPPIDVLVAVSELDRLELPGRGTGWHRSAAHCAGLELDLHLDRGVPTRVQDLERTHRPDRRAHRRGLLGQVEQAILLLERKLAEGLPLRRCEPLGFLDTLDEATGGGAKLELGVDVQAPGDIHPGEEHVTELRRESRVRLGLGSGLGHPAELVAQLLQLLVEIAERAREIRILEANAHRATLHLASVDERRKILGEVVENALPPLLLGFQLLPASLDGAR